MHASAGISDGASKSGQSTAGALELFAGSCKLSKCLKEHGFRACGVDHKRCKNRVGPCVVMDLTRDSGKQFVLKSLESGQIACVPMAPPCGTASRARERRLPKRLRRLGVPEPKPLRSPEFPLGLPGLTGKDAIRVNLANKCYKTAAAVFRKCLELNIPCFIENPKGSRLWDIPFIKELFQEPGVFFTVFHACMHGGSRDKQTALLHNIPEMCSMQATCDGKHQHRAWSVHKVLGAWRFDTSSEAEYPLLLCQRLSRVFAQVCHRKGWSVSPERRAVPVQKQIPSKWRVAGGRQPRGRGARPLIPEDFQIVDLEIPTEQFACLKPWSGRCHSETQLCSRTFPKGSRWITSFPSNSGGQCGDGSVRENQDGASAQNHDHLEGKMTVRIGLPIPPLQAVDMARKLQHPFDSALSASDRLGQAIFKILTLGPSKIHEERVQRIRWMKAMILQTRGDEERIRSRMHPDVRRVTEGKCFCLFEAMLKEINHADKNLVPDMLSGMSITGNADVSGVFAPDFKPAQVEVSDLWKASKFAQEEVQKQIPQHMRRRWVQLSPGNWVDVAKEVWGSTMAEADKGWLEGPLTSLEVSNKVGSLWTPSRRFGILQGSKIRNIDDLSEFAVNQAYGTPEKLDLGGVDEVVALASQWLKAARTDVEIRLSSGQVLRGKLHPELKEEDARELVGRCLDLKSAYKQVALRPSDQANAVLSVYDPGSDCVKFFVSKVLPFGATGAVMGFNRAARAIRDILQSLFSLPIVNYFDDFPHVDLSKCADRSQAVMEEVLQLLGWTVSLEPKKRLPACKQFQVLGVVVDLSRTQQEVVVVSNKPERVEELRRAREEIELANEISPAVAARIQGRLIYAEAQCSGRWLTPLLEPIRARATMPRCVKWLSAEILDALRVCESMMQVAPSRSICAVPNEPPCVVFTDGACEENLTSCGAVIFSPRHAKVIVFGFQVPPEILKVWKKDGNVQLIAQAEMLPIAIVKRQFRSLLQGARVLFFIDNEGVKEALVRGVTNSVASKKILTECMIQDATSNALTWYSRIPSPSNIADGPSRLMFEEVSKAFNVERVYPSLDYESWGKIG